MRRAAKVDSTARDLVQAARQMGAKVLILNDVIDAAVLVRGNIYLVDWKTPRGKRNPRMIRTHRQMELEAEGWPIRYIGTLDGLERLVRG